MKPEILMAKCRVRAESSDEARSLVREKHPDARRISCAGQLRDGKWLVEVWF